MIDYKIIFSAPQTFEGFNEFATAQGNVANMVITTKDGQILSLNDVESFGIVEAVKIDVDEEQDKKLI
ncbi:hypothetical protein [Lysinibacillus sp. G4S2]|uniref:hypothetical protein n=1 Tax=Lysinibacillus sp. G4S2 TaxID=3055859 RepID=UPI0025A1219A|nr:hypothetical protein [Lysinibacillus sp. G4S2]MDM5249034.1 hypothetical protein [Lysinibacillus sp. G4S2]